MFDVGFWEIALIMVVAMLVVGPERLPKLARTLGLWLGKGRGFVRSVKADIDRELAAEELKQQLRKQAELPELYDIAEETDETVRETRQALQDAKSSGDSAGVADRRAAPSIERESDDG
jgi:sec-independent protein translocase protein TatB